ncbi:A-macroglobulin complement component [Thalassoglobus neptunius]|uniref:A-macroglobulin complement component n=1 Tax=Thalassoglobus neptunius TaxID=1938619 RepID=A0A5C5WBL6_9PLAN|nr:prenyltransferase/squalene oxidase repeat-containing protein [Thalassoglobus neptunius]TWT47012.1 A-macroglobulin complement component [Thalassoglobus neptunius]
MMFVRQLISVPVLLVTLIATCFAQSSNNELQPEDHQEKIQQVIAKSIPFLIEEGEGWIEKRGCVSCHQVPFMLWSLDAAGKRGFEVDQSKLDHWKDWATKIDHFANPKNTTDRSEAEIAAANIDTMAQLLLILRTQSEDQPPAWQESFTQYLLDNQLPDGSWNACGQLPFQKRPKTETTQVTTMWTLIALLRNGNADSLDLSEQSLSEHLTPEGTSTEWWVTRLLLAVELNRPVGLPLIDVTEARQQLLQFQQHDGGWGWRTSDPSDALATGMALYALSQTQEDESDSAITRSQQFLIETQTDRGFWEVHSTKGKHQHQVTDTATYWGTAWAVVGLCSSLEDDNSYVENLHRDESTRIPDSH